MEENKKLIVIDASVLIKWYIEEIENKEEALRIRKDYTERKIRLIIPTLCLYETFNTVGIKVKNSAMMIISQIMMMEIEESTLTLANSYQALKIMQKFPKVSFYDAIYHATAIITNGTFITADEKYYQQTKSLKHIKLLRDYK